MMNINRHIIILQPQALLVVCCILAVCLPASCSNDLSKLPGAKGIDYETDRAFNVQFIYSQKGITKAQLFTKEFVRNDKAKPAYVDMLKSLKVNFFNDSLQIDSRLSAKYGRYYPKSGNILVRDSVVVSNTQGDTLKTEELIWNQKEEKFYTEKPVTIYSGGHISTGVGLEANRDFSWMRMGRQRGTVPVDPGDVPGGN